MLRPVVNARRQTQNRRRFLAVETLEDRRLMTADPVIEWNNVLLDAVRATSTPPPKASRAMAIVHTSIYDAVNAIDRTRAPYLVDTVPKPKSDMTAAIAAAAHTTLLSLFPTQSIKIDAAYTAALDAIPNGPNEDDGVALGELVANEILAIRSLDGSSQVVPPFTGGTEDGQWRPTPPALASGLLPFWGTVTPFGIQSGSQFRPGAPPDLNSPGYTDAYKEVYVVGAADAETADRNLDGQPDRTPEQTAIAKFWANGAGTSTPPGHLNIIAQTVSADQGLDTVANARLFALLNIALADAAITSWDAKYEYTLWRPVSGIQDADDGNAETVQEATWTPLLVTPPFPAYTSGHSTFSAAGAAVLRKFFGTDNVSFTIPSENPAAADRSFTSFSQAAEESGQSRIYGGIHWQFDNTEGLSSGTKVGNYVFANYLKEVTQAPAAAIVDGTLAVIGTNRKDFFVFSTSGGLTVITANGQALGSFQNGSFSDIQVDARDGNDSVLTSSNVAKSMTIWGGKGNDILSGGSANDTIFGEAGNDLVYGNKGNDYLYGGAGNDFLIGGRGDDHLFGEGGNDWLIGGLGFDFLDGGTGKNKLFQ